MKKLQKNIAELEQLDAQIKDTVYGSFIYSVLLLNGVDITKGSFVKIIKKCKFPFMDDKDFLEKTWKEFAEKSKNEKIQSLKYEGLPLAVAESPYNTLIVPYIRNNNKETFEDEEGDLIEPDWILCPLNKEGNYNYTLTFATLHNSWKPIDWSKGEE